MNTLNQALQAKFPHLEVSVLKLSEVQKDNESLILGSDFNSNTRQKALQILKSNNKVSDYFDLINATISSITEPSYIYDLTHSLGNFLQDVELTQDILGSNKKEVKENDFIISRLRSYLQEMAVIQAKNYRQLVSTEYIVYRPKTNLLSSNTLMVFALSKIVQTILKLSQYGTEHPRFYEFVFNEMPIPKVIIELNNQINLIMIESYKALEQSKALYKEAEDLLYIELGLNPQNPLQSILQSHSNNINFRIATLKESFLKTGRLDSEYYQVKYEEIESFIQSYQDGFSKLEITEIKDSNFTPKDKEKYRYIELANIGANGNISAPLEELGEDLPTRARRLVKEGDLIISSVEGSLGSCALITKEFHHCVVSTGFYVLKSHSINSETLLVLFKSSFFQHYLKKFPSGTILSAISKEELQNILIPKINPNTQDSIASHIQKSFALRAEAKNLLNEAKAKVESTISAGGGVNSASFVAFRIQIFRIYFPQIKAKLKLAKRHYRLGEWELLEEILFSQDSQKFCCLASGNAHQVNRDTSLSAKVQYDKPPNYTIATLKQTLGTSGRLDSEYYQSKYERNEAVIKSKPYARLKDIVEIKKSIEPGSEAYRESGIPFIRVSNLSPFGISQTEVFLDSKDFKKGELESFYPKANTILLSKDGSIGISYCLENDLECVTSGAILHLTIKNQALVLPQYLSLVLNALPTKLQAQRDSGGSIIAHWKISEIENLLIPLLELSIQEKIESKITQSFALRAKSKELLEEAKAKVEEKIGF